MRPALGGIESCSDWRRFNKIAIQGIPRIAVDKEAGAYRESTHTIITVTFPYLMCNPP